MMIAFAFLALLGAPSSPSGTLPTAYRLETPASTWFDATSAADEPRHPFSYTFLELGYSSTKLDAIDDDAKGLTGRASLGLFDFLYVFLDYSNQTTDFQNTNADLYGLGAGAHFSVMPQLDLVGEAAWISNDIGSDLSTLDESNDGWTAMAGARWMPLPWEGGGLELDGGYRWIDLKGLLSDEQTGAWEVGARVHFLKHLSVGANYSFLEDDKQWGVNARVSF
jgi:opacity protein-like surface antigen